MKTVNLMIIGVGLHARRVYIPYLSNLKSGEVTVNLKLGVDLESQKQDIEDYLKSKNSTMTMEYIQNFDYQNGLPNALNRRLNQLVEENHIDGVLITTEPLVHKAYALWALSNKLHILMDKPVTTRINTSTDIKQAKGIYDDYVEILDKYVKLQSQKNTIFTINVQRRYEIGYDKVKELIREVSSRFNVPVTSIQAMHSDGVWIFPDEVVDQTYHPYSLGYGKNSHSGYHIFDIAWQYYLAGKINNKFPDSFEAITSSLNPSGLLKQINQEDYHQYFGDGYSKLQKRSDKDLFRLYKNYGEIDSFSIIRCLKDGDNICNISINLLHNSFSRRSWLLPSKDLYKGNGRVKHQSYVIQQGPFQCIQVHNYQSNDKQDQSDIEDYNIGGNNHFDIYVFRNSAMFGPNEKPLQIYNLKRLDSSSNLDDTKLYHEMAKQSVVNEFIDFITGKITDKAKLKSNITTHKMAVKIMSAICQSGVRQRNNKSPVIKYKIDD